MTLNERKDLSKVSPGLSGCPDTRGGALNQQVQPRSFRLKEGGILRVAFAVGCSGREKFREEAHHLPGWTQSPLVQEKWEEEKTGKSTGLESGVWSQGAALGSP